MDVDIDVDVDVEVDVDVDSFFGRFTGVSKSIQVPLNATEAALVLAWTILKWRVLRFLIYLQHHVLIAVHGPLTTVGAWILDPPKH